MAAVLSHLEQEKPAIPAIRSGSASGTVGSLLAIALP
jgi:hypothetical protein